MILIKTSSSLIEIIQLSIISFKSHNFFTLISPFKSLVFLGIKISSCDSFSMKLALSWGSSLIYIMLFMLLKSIFIYKFLIFLIQLGDIFLCNMIFLIPNWWNRIGIRSIFINNHWYYSALSLLSLYHFLKRINQFLLWLKSWHLLIFFPDFLFYVFLANILLCFLLLYLLSYLLKLIYRIICMLFISFKYLKVMIIVIIKLRARICIFLWIIYVNALETSSKNFV